VRESLAGHFAVAINITGISQLVHVELFSPILTCPFYSFAVILYPNSHSHTHTHTHIALLLLFYLLCPLHASLCCSEEPLGLWFI